MFDSTITPQDIQKEICRCIELAREGIHAIVLVLSTRNRFSLEEMAAVESLQTIFGERVVDYMIVVFTGGDELEDEGQSLEQYLQPTDSDSAEHNALQVFPTIYMYIGCCFYVKVEGATGLWHGG